MEPKLIVTHYCAKNDINGNPQRLFVVRAILKDSDCANIVQIVDEGHCGENLTARQSEFIGDFAFDSRRILISPSEYKRLRNLGMKLDFDRARK